jgi:hypothetical protein
MAIIGAFKCPFGERELGCTISALFVKLTRCPLPGLTLGKRRVVGREAPGVHTSCGVFTLPSARAVREEVRRALQFCGRSFSSLSLKELPHSKKGIMGLKYISPCRSLGRTGSAP